MDKTNQNGSIREQETEKPEKPPKKKRIKILRPSDILGKERQYIELDGEIGQSFGKIERGTKIFITGRSYSGKSSFITMLCRLMAKHLLVDYNSHEEKGGDASTIKVKMNIAGIDETFDSRIRYYQAPLHSETEETFDDVLSKRGSAGFAVLDSMQHARMDKAEYIRFTNKFCNPRKGKIIAFISHWQKNDLFKHVLHDCDIKLEVMHYVVYVESRLEGATNKPIVIWPEKAKKLWGKNYKNVIEGKYWPGRIKVK